MALLFKHKFIGHRVRFNSVKRHTYVTLRPITCQALFLCFFCFIDIKKCKTFSGVVPQLIKFSC